LFGVFRLGGRAAGSGRERDPIEAKARIISYSKDVNTKK